MTHNEYYQLYKDMDFINPSRVYTTAERTTLNCSSQIISIALERPIKKKGSCKGLFDVCYSNTFSVSRKA